jgi:hypothetical protein
MPERSHRFKVGQRVRVKHNHSVGGIHCVYDYDCTGTIISCKQVGFFYKVEVDGYGWFMDECCILPMRHLSNVRKHYAKL